MRSSRFLPFGPGAPFMTANTLLEPLANDELFDDAVEDVVEADEGARCTLVDADDDVPESDDLGRSKRVVEQYGSTTRNDKDIKETLQFDMILDYK